MSLMAGAGSQVWAQMVRTLVGDTVLLRFQETREHHPDSLPPPPNRTCWCSLRSAELLEFSSIWYETHVPLGLRLSHRQTFDLTADCLWSGSATERATVQATVQATAPPFVQPLHFLHLPHSADRQPEVPPFPTIQE